MSLAPYVPRLALAMLADGPVPDCGRSAGRWAAVLFIDIAGFTALVDAATTRFGDQGAERLQELLNACFVPIVETVDLAGGEVLAFPGDAALCVWPVGQNDNLALEQATRKAAECAVHLRDRLDGMSGFDEIPFRFRAVVTAGPVQVSLAGGVDGRWNVVVHGPAIEQLRTIAAATPGEIVLSEKARRTSSPASLSPASLGANRGEGWIPSGMMSTTPQTADPRTPMAVPQPEAVARLVPTSVHARLETGQQGWMSEFRVVTVVFTLVHTSRLDDGAPHHIVRTIQTVSQRFEGELNQVVVDDKGLTAVIVFGLLQQTHENDSVRAVATAHEVSKTLRSSGIEARIGIATGRVFTGIRGGGPRMEFAVIGSTVVLAARLAAAADDILCDSATQGRARTAFHFDAAPPLSLKGMGVVGNLWRARQPVQSPGTFIEPPSSGGVGRRIEQAQIERRLDALTERGTGGLIVVTGEPGIGKSSLVAEAFKSAATRNIQCIVGAGDSIQLTTTLHAWRSIFTALLASSEPPQGEAIVERLNVLLGSQEAAWFPLLNPVLPVHLPENEQTTSLTAESRARATRTLLVSLLQQFAKPCLFVILEDTHWIDSSSWELIEETAARVPQVLMLLTSRPAGESVSPLTMLKASHKVENIALTAMESPEICEIVARRIGAERLSDDLARWIEGRCEGNPLFAQELTLMLIERGAATIHDGVCAVAGNRTLTELPETVHAVLATRIDRLPVDDQLTLKVAAILGRNFHVESLAAISPLPVAPDALRARIDRIVSTGLLFESRETASAIAFSHGLVQEVAYSLLPFAKRRMLHRSAAEHFEGTGVAADPTLAPLLAYHWEQADVPPKAMLYLERAGEDALLKASANPEAEDFFTRLIRIASEQPHTESTSEHDGSVSRVVRARWERMLSQAISRQGRHAAALAHLQRGLRWLGRSMPSDDWKCKFEALRGVTVRLAMPPPVRQGAESSAGHDVACLEAARLYDSVVQLLYLGQTTGSDGTASTALVSAVALLRAAALGEGAGPCGELSRSYTMVANLIAMLGRPGLASQYAERARQLAIEIEDKQALFRALTIGQLPAFIFGRWDDAENRLREGVALGASLRNVHESLVAECTLAYISFHRGRVEDAFTRFKGVETQAQDAGFVLPQLWAKAGISEVQLRQDRLLDAIVTAEACLRLASERNAIDQNCRFQVHGVLASARSRRGEYEQALAEVEPAARAATAGAHLSFSAQAGFIGVTEALFAACASGVIDARDGEARVRHWLWRFRAAAFCRPILEPWSLHFRAMWNHRKGRSWRAKRQLLKSIRLAESLGMPYEASRGRLALTELASS
jgi:class 3 adenylate cyclase/tetratricopeptide (TPR) repeat protein